VEASSFWRNTIVLSLLCTVTVIAAHAQDFSTLLSFNYANGADPLNARLVQGVNGKLYGTTAFGGSCPLYGLGCGTVFVVTSSGGLTTLHDFSGPDGAFPYSGLLLATDGNFYGTTQGGGANCASSNGCGTLFRMTPTGELTTIYSFCSLPNCTDGQGPSGGLVQGNDGNLYGTTTYGGSSDNCSLGCGTVFKVTPAGKVVMLTSFTGPPGGFYPSTRLIQATDGNFYGTTESGGANCCGAGWGTIFQVTPKGTLTTLYSFCSQADCTDGSFPVGGVMQAVDGNLYGTTRSGGTGTNCAGGCGTAFRANLSGTPTILHNFTATDDGFSPSTSLIQATDGNFYGTTVQDGYDIDCLGDCGTIFKMTPAGNVTTLDTFTAAAAGSDLTSPLEQATDGNFYGTTYVGGQNGAGTIFSLSTGLRPFVRTAPNTGKVGTTVKILGTNLTRATCVSFNGIAAPFTVASPSLIIATVPAGATTGKVKVMTAGGTLVSNIAFTVVP